MSYEIKDFIGVFDNADMDNFCDSLIEQFNSADHKLVKNRQQEGGFNTPKVAKDDLHLFSLDLENGCGINEKFYEKFWADWYIKYVDQYGILKTLTEHTGQAMKIQKTEPGQGYHIWHCEADNFKYASRVFAWILYLNDVEEGGETEFLYQHKRVQPKKGRFVLWPAYFTHPHRGNPPLKGTKYIATGWVVFTEPVKNGDQT